MNKEGQPNPENDLETKRYGHGTLLLMRGDEFIGGQVLCSDGQVRRLRKISPHPQTAFETTASLVVEDDEVAGSILFETIDGQMRTKRNPIIVKFSARGKYSQKLPPGVYREERNM